MQIVAGNAAAGDLETVNSTDRVVAEFELADHNPQWYEATVWMDKGYQPRIAFPNGPLGVKGFRKGLVCDYPDRFKGYIDNWVPPYNNMHPTYDQERSQKLIAAFRKEQNALKRAGKPYMIYGTSQSINMRDAWAQFYAEYDGPRVRVYEIEIEGPINRGWPPAPYRRLFGTVRPTDKNAKAADQPLCSASVSSPCERIGLSIVA